MVISAGSTSPERFDVRALYSLQNAMILMPWLARAGPTGGAGLAFPASSWRRTTALSFFAILFLLSGFSGSLGMTLPPHQASLKPATVKLILFKFRPFRPAGSPVPLGFH